MREIKFRAFTTDTKIMWNWEEIRKDFSEVIKDANWVLMQYTGLKDKNGKEIYEGDFVKVYSEVVREVVFKNAFWQMEEREMTSANVLGGFGTPQEDAHKPIYRYPERDIEIVGNIYENPELLNSEQEDKRSVARDDDSSNKAD